MIQYEKVNTKQEPKTLKTLIFMIREYSERKQNEFKYRYHSSIKKLVLYSSKTRAVAATAVFEI